MAVQAVPPGCDRIIAHLTVKSAADAIAFYTKAFGAVETMRMPGPDGKSIMHAEVVIGSSKLFLVDEMDFPGAPKAPGTLGGTSVTLTMYVEDAQAVYDRAVKAGAEATMPPMDAFWGDRYGKLKDPFGHDWAIVHHIEDVPPEDMPRRAMEAMKEMGGM